MPTIFPTWPHILFGVLEPISLALGSVFPVYDLRGFIAGQTPTIVAPATLHPSSIALAYQLGNLYSLLFLVGVGVCHATTEPRVLHNYLIGLAIADVGHVYATYLGMGWDAFADVAGWNALTWGNIGVTTFLFLNRIAYFLGIFGYAKAPKAAAKRE
ncbi:hypothetical protein PDIG_04700 [Penicillium digitatum PHI26]|uniref:DUF7704 domain-containing protein n=2 Tax=Penicillium digitatum TaxID=36651 RepID=K9GWK1_PEND2|nr:hypothetical protein PDIP_09370 [Penicillium digitatum Pd1]EKV18973.1 hypothetical protein PDIG_04700 [Penicillium digitatum PHI26]EKV21111.1 hypothetical protein PDIP_09370 [Penicillium digitatum Pd1]KAG0154055.1 hypothetical protein PDIDSM_1435 [Penicillium digitatum]